MTRVRAMRKFLTFLVALGLVVLPVVAKKKKTAAVPILKTEGLRNILGVKPKYDGEVADCGVVLYLMAPIVSNDFNVQRKEQDKQRKTTKVLKRVSKLIGDRRDVVAFGRFPFAPNKIWMRTHTTVETWGDEWMGSIAFAKSPAPQLRKRWAQRKLPLEFVKLKDGSAAGIAHFLNENCGTHIDIPSSPSTKKDDKEHDPQEL